MIGNVILWVFMMIADMRFYFLLGVKKYDR